MTKNGPSIENRSTFDFIRYANCWEDAAILTRALEMGPGKSYVSIASAGDNSLALLTLNPSLVVAVDLSSVQLACTELKKVAIEHCEYETVLWFLGYLERTKETGCASRLEYYSNLRRFCSSETRNFWDGRSNEITSGIIYKGKFERYFGIFRKHILPLIHNREKVLALLEKKEPAQRELFYEKQWNTLRWRLLFRFFFSRFVMGRSGRDPEFFRYVKGSVAGRILQRTRHALTVLPTHNNPYLRFILTGSFGNVLPYYLHKENFEIIKKNIACLQLCHGTLDAAFCDNRQYDGFNLSDIFEYMDEPLFENTCKSIVDSASPGANIAYWNMLVPRRIASILPEKISPLDELSQELFNYDQAFFYQAFFVDKVK